MRIRYNKGPVDKSKKTAETHRGSSRTVNLGIRKTNSLSGVRITDTIARGKVIGVNEGVVTVKPMVSRTNVAKLQSLASTNTMVGVNAIENKMKTFG